MGAINMSSLNKKELALILTELNTTGYTNTTYNYNVLYLQ